MRIIILRRIILTRMIAAYHRRIRTRVIHIARRRHPILRRRHTQTRQLIQIMLRNRHHVRSIRRILYVEIIRRTQIRERGQILKIQRLQIRYI